MSKDLLPRWHPCDEFFKPIIERLAPLALKESDITADEFVNAMSVLSRTDWYLTGIYWLEENTTPEFADRVNNRLEETNRAIGCVWADVVDLYTFQPGYAFAWAAGEPFDAQQARKLTRDWSEHKLVIADTYCWLLREERVLRQSVTFDRIPRESRFVPSELQRLILDALRFSATKNCRGMTADQLEGELNVSRSTLYGGKVKKGRKAKTGGLMELVELGLVVNDRKRGGYYCPDTPPKSN